MGILLLPVFLKGDILAADFTTLQHQGIYLSNSTSLTGTEFIPGDRIIRINGCTIETHLSGNCDILPDTATNTYDLIRNNQVISVQTHKPDSFWGMIQPNITGTAGVLIFIVAGLIILLNVSKVRWYPHILIILLLFSLIFALESVKLPLCLFLHPNLFWIYQAVFIVTQTTLRAVVLNLVLVYPQHRFKKKKTRRIILGFLLILPPIVLLGALLTANNLFTGIRQEYEWLDIYSIAMLGFILFTLLYHIGNAQRPIVNLRLRWLRIGTITIIVLMMGFVLFVFAFSGELLQTLTITLDNMLKVLSHPFTLIIVTLPLLYAIPLGEQYPHKIDNLENRILFYLVLSIILALIYALVIALFTRFDFILLLRDPYTYFGLALTIVVMVVFALLRSPVDRFINGWFYRDRLKYQTLLPGFILELSANLSHAQLRQLLLNKLPADFDISSTVLVLREPGGESYSIVTGEEELSPTQFSKNHPLIQHFLTTRQPILRFLDQKMLHPGIVAAMEKMDVEAAIPLMHHGNLVGVFFLRRKKNGNPYSISELKVLNELDEWAGTAVYNTWVVSEKEDYSRSLEMEMEEQSRELDRVVDETRKYQRSTQQKTQQKESIIGQIHEDLRKPLNNISALATILYDKESIDPKNLDLIQHETNLLASRLGTFLDYSAIQNAKFQPKLDDCDLSKLFQQVIASLQREIPSISERISFHLDALCPLIVKLDPTRLSQILTTLIQATLFRFPDQAFVVTCGLNQPEDEFGKNPVSLSFLCKLQPDVIIIQKVDYEVDQLLLKMELVNQLILRMEGELLKDPMNGNSDFPFHFLLNGTVPADSYPVYMSVDLPFLKGKSIVVFDQESESRKQLALQTSSWGINVITVEEYEKLLSVINETLPDLVLINGNNSSPPDSWEQSLSTAIRTVVYHSPQITKEESNLDQPKTMQPQRLYSLITKALLFATTTGQFPHLPRNLALPSHAIAEGKQLLLVGENENASRLIHYLSRFNLETSQYMEKLDQLPAYLEKNCVDILLIELATREQQEWKILRSVRKQEIDQPFIIATSANPIRFPALDVLKAGADKYVLKPYKIEELLTMIAEWLTVSRDDQPSFDE